MEERVATAAQGDLVGERPSRENESARITGCDRLPESVVKTLSAEMCSTEVEFPGVRTNSLTGCDRLPESRQNSLDRNVFNRGGVGGSSHELAHGL